MEKKITSDVYDINKDGALIIGKKRLDDYAAKFLNKYCKEALETPMSIPVERIIEDMGLIVIEERLSKNLDVFGCCILLDSEIEVYDPDKDKTVTKKYPAGTILIDPLSEEIYGRGSMRNTLMHEALHWEKDKFYFEIKELKNKRAKNNLNPVMCRRTETLHTPSLGRKTKREQVEWLEWQAHRLAPRVLMPKESFRTKSLEFLDNESNMTCEILIHKLSEFFEVSKLSVKYRLAEVGLENRLKNLDDYEIFYLSNESQKEHVKITLLEAFEMLEKNVGFKNWVETNGYVFVEGYFVLAREECLVYKDGKYKLAPKVKRNLKKYTVNIIEQSYKDFSQVPEYLSSYSILFRGNGISKEILLFHPDYQGGVEDKNNPMAAYKYFYDDISNVDQNLVEFETRLGDPKESLCCCLWFMMRKRGWASPEIFEEKTELYKNLYSKIRSDKANNMKKETLMAICVALGIGLRLTEQVLKKAGILLNPHVNPDKTYIKILERAPSIDLWEFNSVLEVGNLEPLGSKIRF